MVILGVLILLVFAGIVIATVARGDDPTLIDLDWFVLRSTVAGVFLAGALTLLLALVGVLVLLAGLRRSRRRRADIKDLRDRAAANAAAAEQVRALEAERSGASSGEHASSRRRAPDGRREPGGSDESFDPAPRDR
ncbi:MAG: hypothetical protein WKF72_00950 [Nocardioidaceae bacterium]